MLCLHGKPAVSSTTENGTFWSCSEPSTCFVCSEEEKYLYDKAIKAFLATKQDRPRCCGIVPSAQAAGIERYYANYYKFRVYTGTRPHKQWNPYKPLGGFVSAADAERHYAKFRVYTGKEQHGWWSGYKNILVDLFSRVEKLMMRGTPNAVATLSGEIKTLLQNRYVTMVWSVE